MSRRWSLVAGAIAALTLAAPLSAAPTGDVKAGEAVFYDRAFSASPTGVPLKVFEALQEIEPDFSRHGLERKFGFLHREGRALPIGVVSAPALGVDRLTFNCSVCHTGLVGGRAVPGMPNNRLDLQSFEEAIYGAIAKPSFGPDTVLPAIRARHARLDWAEEAQIRLWLTLAKGVAAGKQPSPHRAGPGRFDLMQTFKTRLGLPAHDFNAHMDVPALFSQGTLKRYPRDGALGGDQDLVRYLIVRLSGDNTPLKGDRYPDWVGDLNAYLASLTPPPFPGPVDAAEARRGLKVFRASCAGCHGTYDAYDQRHPNRVVPIEVVGTDANRIRVWDDRAVKFVTNDPLMQRLDLAPGVGFVPPSLRGVWATAPYLHNGSVPTLHDVLSAPDTRPKRFWRGGDAFDPVRVGLSSVQAPAAPDQFLVDTTIAGNGNQGHPFGVPLSAAERKAVIEYLKTL